MTPNITIITSILLTAALTAGGTYYVATNMQPGVNQSAESKPVTVAVNQQPDKPIEIIVRTEIVDNHHPIKHHDYIAEGIAARSRPQPHYGVMKSPGE